MVFDALRKGGETEMTHFALRYFMQPITEAFISLNKSVLNPSLKNWMTLFNLII